MKKFSQAGFLAAVVVCAVVATGCLLILPPVSEGTESSPIDIGNAAAGEITYEGEVGNADSSYYVAAVSEDTGYTIGLEGLTADLGLWIFSDSGFSSPLGRSRNDGSADESITVTTILGAEKLYIRVDPEAATGSRFTLTMR